MDSGHIVLTGRDPATILQSVNLVTQSQLHDRQQPIAKEKEYEVTNTSYRMLKLILGTAKPGHLWDGIVAA